MKTTQLQKALRAAHPRKVPADLRERLVAAIPEHLAPLAEPQARWIRPRWAYGVAAACLLIAALHLGGLIPWPGNQVSRTTGTSFSLVPAAFASVVDNLKNTGAFILKLDVRAPGSENFEAIDPEAPFAPVQIWLERPSARFAKGRMRVEKPERWVVFDGQATLFYITNAQLNTADAKIYPGGRIDQQLADPARWLEEYAPSNSAQVCIDTLKGLEGRILTRLSVQEEGIETAEGWHPVFYDQFTRRTVISWDAQTKQLVDLEKYVQYQGREVLVTKLRSIEFRESLEDSLFSQALPAGTHVMGVADPTNQRYADLGPVEVARKLFQAWQEEDWDTARLFCESDLIVTYMRLNKLKSYRITGQPFKFIPIYPGYQVPYELVFESGEVKKFALALRNDNEMKRYIWDGGI